MNITELLSQQTQMKPGGATPHLEGFASELASVGHTRATIKHFLDAAMHFGGWVEAKGIDFAEMDEQTVKAFGAHRCKCPGRRKKRVSQYCTARVGRFVDYLRRYGVIPVKTSSTSDNPSPLNGFRDWLLGHRGLAVVTVDGHERLITRLLPGLGTDPAKYDAGSVRKTILHEIRGCRPGYAKTIVGALRVYLRFLAANGACRPDLDRALPPVAQWRLSALPRYLDATQAAHLIDCCAKSEPLGLRDRAIVLLLIRLGLRAGDIANMRPADIDWQDATLVVRGKGRRDVRLPLPQDAGDAVLEYIEHTRPQVAIDRVFLCATAPYRPLRSGSSVSGIVRFALQRAGITNPPTCGANLLRHTTATMMLRAGATLEEIGTVLRHRSLDTTAHYAKVDVASLQKIAQPWPEGSKSC